MNRLDAQRLALTPAEWAALPGGTDEAHWLADRDRKFGLAADLAERVLHTAGTLRKRGALFRCTPEVLAELPLAADWYVSLAGFAMKTLGNVREKPRQFDLDVAAKGLVEALRKRQPTDPLPPHERLVAFSCWINAEIDDLFPSDKRNPLQALSIACMIFGGRIIGQGQNAGGSEAVTLFKTSLLSFLIEAGNIEVLDENKWVYYQPHLKIDTRDFIRYEGKIVFQTIPGGDRPDMVIYLDTKGGSTLPVGYASIFPVLAVGEIKGRKDLSNAWESWMPQVDAHMQEWGKTYPDAARLFFGTLITEPMVVGMSVSGTPRPGFRQMHERGDLASAYNLSKVATREEVCTGSFARFAEEVRRAAEGT